MAYVLIVDDDEDFASAAATVLRNTGHEVEIAYDIRSASRSMEARRPDLVVLDVMFPEDSSAGFEFAREMQQGEGEFKGVPILMLTAVNTKLPLGFSERDIDNHWLPVADFVEKPVDFDVLVRKVAALVAEGGPGT